MKKLLVLVLSLALLCCFSLTALAKDNSESYTNSSEEALLTAEGEDTAVSDGDMSNGQLKKQENALKKAFKAELNAQKKELQQQKSQLAVQLEAEQAEYDALVAAGDAAGAEAMLPAITELKEQLDALQNQIKQTINERYMIVKTMYNAEELAGFENAAAVIAQMYADAAVLGAGSITVKNNIIKLDAPAYIKGGRTIIPVRAITEQLGAQVTWDETARTVTVTKDNLAVVFAINSSFVYVDGAEVELDVAPEITCGRTYVPLRFLAETFGLTVTWDDENDIVDIDEGEGDDTGDDTGGEV